MSESLSFVDASYTGETNHQREERDEVLELHKLSSKENFRVRSLCGTVTLLLLVTAIAVTTTSYLFLDDEEENNFDTAFQQFARTVGDAAIDQQRDLRHSMIGLANAISSYAVVTNATWPYFAPLLFESFAIDFKELSRAEIVALNNLVKHDQRDSYIEFANANYQEWIEEGHMIAHGNTDRLDKDTSKYNPFVSRAGPNGFEPDIDRDIYHVLANLSPPPRAYGPVTNWNSAAGAGGDYAAVMELGNETVISEVRPFRALPPDEHRGYHDDDTADNPHSFVIHPIHAVPRDSDSGIVATLSAAIAWDASMRELLPENVQGIVAVVKNSCGQVYTYEIKGKKALYRGAEDMHERKYDGMVFEVDLSLHTHPNFTQVAGHCLYRMEIYPSSEFEGYYNTRTPERFAFVVGAAFVLVLVVFIVFDYMVHKRNEVLIFNAAKSNAIVTSLFPGAIRDRLLKEKELQDNSHSLRSYLTGPSNKTGNTGDTGSKPLADLYVEATVMFADIVGFTAWSSTRDPTQVFMLLETVYSAFDELAKKHKVFKVETVGDCYVAVTGVPTPQTDHALVMARFARSCLVKMYNLMESLEVSLGPDTGDLSIRIGIHSGPVTAGVLRGERARFQLFGDTMNTTARMESTSQSGRIQLSQDTATLLAKAGKADWIQKRENKIIAKGKGELQTYWLKVGKTYDDNDQEVAAFSYSTRKGNNDQSDSRLDKRTLRLVEWNVETLVRLLKEIVARSDTKSKTVNKSVLETPVDSSFKKAIPLEEVKEIIALPQFDMKKAIRQKDADKVVLPSEVVEQLHDLVKCIAQMYRDNAFHSFDHASHVVMSMTKYMTRIVAPTELDLGDLMDEDKNKNKKDEESISNSSREKPANLAGKKMAAASLHDHTYGITSDPLTQFACVFSALIHDVDHTGVPNPQLIKENPDLAAVYNNRSVAEQNSFDLSWNLFMDPRFEAFRSTLCSTKSSLMRFRQLVINAVMATDLGDKELKALRNSRWDKAFKKSDGTITVGPTEENEVALRDDVNRKATIVIEHLIQASDVAHTMQHWHVYRKWNERLFMEMYDAYLKGRAEKNPADFWYEGELGFFDFYIIPLAKKLKDCGVFGVSSDETLDYAQRNRAEWEARGREVVAEMMEKVGCTPPPLMPVPESAVAKEC